LDIKYFSAVEFPQEITQNMMKPKYTE